MVSDVSDFKLTMGQGHQSISTIITKNYGLVEIEEWMGCAKN